MLTVDVYTASNTGTFIPSGSNSEINSATAGTWSSAGNTPVELAGCNGTAPNYEIGPMVFRLDGTVVAFGGIGLGGREQRDL